MYCKGTCECHKSIDYDLSNVQIAAMKIVTVLADINVAKIRVPRETMMKISFTLEPSTDSTT